MVRLLECLQIRYCKPGELICPFIPLANVPVIIGGVQNLGSIDEKYFHKTVSSNFYGILNDTLEETEE